MDLTERGLVEMRVKEPPHRVEREREDSVHLDRRRRDAPCEASGVRYKTTDTPHRAECPRGSTFAVRPGDIIF